MGGGEDIFFLVILQLVPHFTEILLWYNFSASKNMASQVDYIKIPKYKSQHFHQVVCNKFGQCYQIPRKKYIQYLMQKMVKFIFILFDQVSENEMTEFLENAPEFCREKIRQAAFTESSESKTKTKHI